MTPRTLDGRAPSLLRAWITPLVMAAIVVLASAAGITARADDHDFQVFLGGGQRLLDGEPLYRYHRPHESWHVMNQDFQGPPFQGVFFVPWALAARANYVIARGAWDLLLLVSVLVGLWCWIRAMESAVPAAAPLWRSREALVAVCTVALPIYSNAYTANTSSIVFALTGAAALALTRGRDTSAGVALGAAAAFKAFPALCVVYLLWRRSWRAAIAAMATGAMLTLVLLPVLGWPAYVDTVRAWLAHADPAAWPQWSHNQSVAMLVRRWLPASTESLVLAGWMATTLGFLHFATRSTKAPDLAIVCAIAVLLSPIAWNHYFLLLVPAVLYAAAAPGPSRRARRWAIAAAAVLLSGVSRITLGDHGAEMARQFGANTVAAVLVALAAAQAVREHQR